MELPETGPRGRGRKPLPRWWPEERLRQLQPRTKSQTDGADSEGQRFASSETVAPVVATDLEVSAEAGPTALASGPAGRGSGASWPSQELQPKGTAEPESFLWFPNFIGEEN